METGRPWDAVLGHGDDSRGVGRPPDAADVARQSPVSALSSAVVMGTRPAGAAAPVVGQPLDAGGTGRAAVVVAAQSAVPPSPGQPLAVHTGQRPNRPQMPAASQAESASSILVTRSMCHSCARTGGESGGIGVRSERRGPQRARPRNLRSGPRRPYLAPKAVLDTRRVRTFCEWQMHGYLQGGPFSRSATYPGTERLSRWIRTGW